MTHKQVSLIKSMIRIVGFTVLGLSLYSGLVILIIAELLGVLEEWV
jgi:hypothetical protein